MASFINKLKQAPAACAARKRKAFVVRNKKGRGPSKKPNGARSNDVSVETAKKRTKEFMWAKIGPNGIWCGACKCDVGSSMGTMRQHEKSAKHMEKAAAMAAKDEGDKDRSRAMIEAFAELAGDGHHTSGTAGVPPHTQEFRAEVLEVMLYCGVPVRKIDKFRSFLERRCNNSLVRSDHMMRTYLPALRVKEFTRLELEHKDEDTGIGFDGTSLLGEAFAITSRTIPKPHFHVHQCCIAVKWTCGSMDNQHISAELFNTVCVEMCINVKKVLSWSSDCASANLKAFNETLGPATPNSDHNGCIPHTDSHAAEKFSWLFLTVLMEAYHSMFKVSEKARVIFAEDTGKFPVKKSNTRWYFESNVVEASIDENLPTGKFLAFVNKIESVGLCPETCKKMTEVITNPRKLVLLKRPRFSSASRSSA